MANGNTNKGLETGILSYLWIQVKRTRTDGNKRNSSKGCTKYFRLSLIFSRANSHIHLHSALVPSQRNSCKSAEMYVSIHTQLLLSESQTIPDSVLSPERGGQCFFECQGTAVISNIHVKWALVTTTAWRVLKTKYLISIMFEAKELASLTCFRTCLSVKCF
jgi:hypothetical protein